ncbi:MAG TPA: hypothetical protein VNK44_06940 [Candidatus Nitrosotenuis sp.]|nr:hypothetical protein [Candidatus Nitrosotenuis sp.]
MKLLFLLVLVVTSTPAFAQEFTNPSLVLQHVDIAPADFNKVESEIVIVPFEKPHPGSWQITIQNNLLYANPKGNAVLRLYDANISDKFLEIGMGSPPDRKFWVAINLPDQGYVPATRLDRDGWYEGSKIIAAHSDEQGVTIGNGKRIVVSNFNLQDFVVGSYAVYGMTDEADPPAINSGTFSVEILSGDVSKNPIHYYPFYVTGAVGAIIGILLILKKRS